MMPTLSGVPSIASGPSCLSQGCRSGFFSIVEEGPPNISVLRGFVPIDSHVEQFQVLLRSEEHTSELQSRQYLVCRLLLEKKKKKI